MTATVTKAGPYYSTGSISFSSLRSNFKETSSGTISASELKRITSTSNTNPIVPDCTENRTSGPLSNGISTGNDLKLSQFRNSIKYYYITQTGTDLNFDIDAQSWNNNLTKNIKKWAYINGTCGTNSTSSFASTFDATAYNLTIDVSGGIYGAGGVGGTSATIAGSAGGGALSVQSTGGNNIVVFVRSGSNIYGGGGGGEKGATGAAGATQTCYSTYQVTDTSCNPGDAQSYSYAYSAVIGQNCWWRWCCETQCNDVYGTFTVYNCSHPFSVTGAPGGVGGNGTLGRGYNNQIASLLGSAGTVGTTGGCPTYGATGYTGETGGDGGDWGNSGGSTTNTGNGGTAGRAISGSNYSVDGAIDSNTIRGLYNP
jgi:hypothetical protein